MGNTLKIFTDGGSRGNPGTAGFGIVVYDEAGSEVFHQSSSIGQATNNEAEYKAFLASIEWLVEHAKSNTIDEAQWFLDSKLVVEQINKRWKIKEPRLRIFAEACWSLLDSLDFSYRVSHVKRDENARADQLANEAMDAA